MVPHWMPEPWMIEELERMRREQEERDDREWLRIERTSDQLPERDTEGHDEVHYIIRIV